MYTAGSKRCSDIFLVASVLFNMTGKLNPFTLNNCLIVNYSSVDIIPKKDVFAFLIFYQNVTTCSTLMCLSNLADII